MFFRKLQASRETELALVSEDLVSVKFIWQTYENPYTGRKRGHGAGENEEDTPSSWIGYGLLFGNSHGEMM